MDHKGHIQWEQPLSENPSRHLKSPLMIIALQGLFDVGEGATSALHHLIKHTQAQKIATINSEEFFDFSRERPIMSLEGGDRQILWPDTVCHATVGRGGGDRGSFDVRSDDSDRGSSSDGGNDVRSDQGSDDLDSSSQRDLLLVVGVEPHLRWRTFAGYLVDIVTEFGVSTVVSLGSPPGHAPHTRPLGVIGSTTNQALAAQLGLGPPTYQGPTGLVGVLHEQLDKLGVPSFSLKVSVPHYVTSPPNPEASRSLLARLELITGIETGHNTFDDAADQWREQIDLAVAADEDIAHYVRRLEQEIDSTEGMMPTGSDLAQQLEAFLRGQGDVG